MTAILEVVGVTVRFGGLTANHGVDLTVGEAEIAALIGPNGAGKTTLFNAVTGAVVPSAGQVRFAGVDVTRLGREARARLGIARTFQNLSLVGGLSALDNATVGLGRFRRAGLVASMLALPRARRQDEQIRAIADEALTLVGLGGSSARMAGDLAYVDRRRLELARALALAPRLLLLDEPSAGMGWAETAEMANVIRRVRDELGVTVLVVEHDMSFVRRLADRITVLANGAIIASGLTAEVLADDRVATVYLGTGVSRA